MTPDVDEARAAWERAVEDLERVDDAGRPDAEARAAEALEALGEAIDRAGRERVPVAPTPYTSPDLPPIRNAPRPAAPTDDVVRAGPPRNRGVSDLLEPVGPTSIRNAPDLLEPVGPFPIRNAPEFPTPVGPRPTRGIDLPAPKGFFDDADRSVNAITGVREFGVAPTPIQNAPEFPRPVADRFPFAHLIPPRRRPKK